MTSDSTLLSDSKRDGLAGQLMDAKLLGGSLVSWLTLGLTLLGLGYNFAVSHVEMRAMAAANTYQVQRNREEAQERFKSVESSINNVYTSLSAINSIKIDVEVIKSEMKGLSEQLRRIERQGRSPQLK